MWRRTTFPRNCSDSDQSISDEEDFNGDLGGNCVSLAVKADKEEGFQLQSQLEILRAKNEISCGTETGCVQEKQTSFFDEDDVELPDFPDDGGLKLGKEATRTYCKSSKYGVRGKGKPKFSFHLQPQKLGFSQPSIAKDEHVFSAKVCDTPGKSETMELLGDSCQKNEKQLAPAEVEAFGHGFVEHSMAEILDGLHDKNIIPRGNSKMLRGGRQKRSQLAIMTSVSPVEDRSVENEDQLELMANRSPSVDDDANCQSTRLSSRHMNGQTMVDRFHDALKETSLSNEGALVTIPKIYGIGLFGELQRVMHSEKERDNDFLKKLQKGASLRSELHSMMVKILSKYLDAKLTVCHCSIVKNIEGSLWPENLQLLVDSGRKRTVIFNPRVCSDVDLEVGNFVCIQPPWKEVQVEGNDESIVLSTYFTQILT